MLTADCLHISGACRNGSFPEHFVGDWYSIDQGNELLTDISAERFHVHKLIDDARCHDIEEMPGSRDAQGNYDAKVLLHIR